MPQRYKNEIEQLMQFCDINEKTNTTLENSDKITDKSVSEVIKYITERELYKTYPNKPYNPNIYKTILESENTIPFLAQTNDYNSITLDIIMDNYLEITEKQDNIDYDINEFINLNYLIDTKEAPNHTGGVLSSITTFYYTNKADESIVIELLKPLGEKDEEVELIEVGNETFIRLRNGNNRLFSFKLFAPLLCQSKVRINKLIKKKVSDKGYRIIYCIERIYQYLKNTGRPFKVIFSNIDEEERILNDEKFNILIYMDKNKLNPIFSKEVVDLEEIENFKLT